MASFWQTRLILMGACAYPLLIGYVLARLLSMRGGDRRSAATIAFLAVAILLLFPTQVASWLNLSKPDTQEGRRTHNTCRTTEALETLASVPTARIFAIGNLTAPMLVVTDHAGLTGPYHRNPQAMADAIAPFFGDETTLQDALKRTEADYLLLCSDATFWIEDSFASSLSQGASVDWLTPVTGLHEDVLLLRVERESQ